MVEMFHRDALPPRHRLKPNLNKTEPMLAGGGFKRKEQDYGDEDDEH